MCNTVDEMYTQSGRITNTLFMQNLVKKVFGRIQPNLQIISNYITKHFKNSYIFLIFFAVGNVISNLNYNYFF